MTDDRRTPSWNMLDAARRALQPEPEDGLLAVSDAELLRDYWRAVGDRNAGLATVQAVGEVSHDETLSGATGDTRILVSDAAHAAYAASLRSLSDADLLQRWHAAWALVCSGAHR